MFGNHFCVLFLKTCFWEYKLKKEFLYFLNQKHVWLVEIKKLKKKTWRKKKLKYVVIRIWNIMITY